MSTRQLLAMGLAALGAVLLVAATCTAAESAPPPATRAAEKSASPDRPPSPPLPPLGVEDKPLRRLGLGKADPASSGLAAPDSSINDMLWRSVAGALLVLVLGGCAFFFMKRLMPRLGITRGKRISVLETAYLGPQRSVHLVQVGVRCLLVGSSRETVALIADVTDALPPEEDAAKPKARFVIPELAADGADPKPRLES